MTDFVLVALGAVVGGPARFLVDRWVQLAVARNHPGRVPVGTLTVNVVGSSVLGIAAALLSGPLLLVVGIGFCGSFTTFSTFAALSEESRREGWPWVAATNVVASVVLCLFAFWVTYSVAGG